MVLSVFFTSCKSSSLLASLQFVLVLRHRLTMPLISLSSILWSPESTHAYLRWCETQTNPPPRLRSALLCLLDGPVFYVRLLEAEQKVWGLTRPRGRVLTGGSGGVAAASKWAQIKTHQFKKMKFNRLIKAEILTTSNCRTEVVCVQRVCACVWLFLTQTLSYLYGAEILSWFCCLLLSVGRREGGR